MVLQKQPEAGSVLLLLSHIVFIMLRIRALRPDKLASSLNNFKRLSTAPGSGKPSNGAKTTAPKETSPSPIHPGYQPKTASATAVKSSGGDFPVVTTLFTLVLLATGVSYKIEADKAWHDFAEQKAPFLLTATAPLRTMVQYSGIMKEEREKKRVEDLDKEKEKTAKREAVKAERAAYREAYLNVAAKEEEEAKKAAAAVTAAVEQAASDVSESVAEAVQSVKQAEQHLISAVEKAADALSSELAAEVEAVHTPAELAPVIAEELKENEAEQAKDFNAHEEAHDLEVKYHMTTSTDAAAAEVEKEAAEEVVAAAAAAVATRVQPSMNELNQTTLHYELQTQARKILSELQEELHHSKIRELIVQHQQELAAALKKQQEELEAKLKHDLEKQERLITRSLQDELNHQVAVLRQAQVEEMLALQPRIDGIKAQLRTYEVVADETAEAIKETLRSNRLASAILALEYALSIPTGQRTSVAGHFDSIKLAAQDDPLVSSVIGALPKSVIQNGALHSSELHLRFNIMKEEVRKVALAPEEAPKMVGQLIGTVLAYLTWAPKGFVSGSGVEDVLARTEYYLERGHVREALNELKSIKGYARVLMKDFESLAEDRLLVDQSIAILKAKSVLKHKALAP